MGIKVLGGSLSPRQHDGQAIDSVYGVDADGFFIGCVPAAQAHAVATVPPPRHGRWKWDGTHWVVAKTREQRAQEIERQRDEMIAAGVQWNGVTWYADQTFQQQLQAYLQAFGEGIVAPGAGVRIRAKDGVVRELARNDLRQLAATVMQHVSAAWEWSWQQKAQL